MLLGELAARKMGRLPLEDALAPVRFSTPRSTATRYEPWSTRRQSFGLPPPAGIQSVLYVDHPGARFKILISQCAPIQPGFVTLKVITLPRAYFDVPRSRL